MRELGKRLARLAGVLALLAGLYAAGAWLYGAAPEHPFFAGAPDVSVVAHRGGAGRWPENTLYAFYKASELGADVLEMDVRASADGVPMVIHDPRVDRTTDGEGRVDGMTAAELHQLDAGHGWQPPDGQSQQQDRAPKYAGLDIRIPRLRGVLRAFPRQRLNLEIKPADPDLARAVCGMLRRDPNPGRVLIASAHQRVLTVFRRNCPSVATAAGPREVRLFGLLVRFSLGRLYLPVEDAVQVPASAASARAVTAEGFIRSANERNLAVHAWTVNERDAMVRLIDEGVDGIITDYPGRLLRLLGRDQR